MDIQKGDSIWALTYFRQRYPTRIELDENGNTIEVPLPDPMLEAQLHIALSKDGRHWIPLNNNKPVWDHWMRDPFLHQGPDGVWRLLATGGDPDKKGNGPSCFYATSTDLIHWETSEYLPLMKDATDAQGAYAGNIWAPEWFYDEQEQEYFLFWSSSFKDAGWKESRLWYCRTKDWKTFSQAKILFAPSYSVIDGTLLQEHRKYYLFHKEEEFGAKTGERRAIRVAVSQAIDGPYTVVEGSLNQGQIAPVITEGPAVIADPTQAGWLLVYDYCMTNRFGVSHSTDLQNWTIAEDIAFPPDARHASVLQISPAMAKALWRAFPNTKE